MKVNVCSETQLYGMQGEGVHTSFIDCVALLKQQNDVEVAVNNEFVGDVMHCHTYGPYYFWRGLKYKGKRIYTAHVIPDSAKGTIPFYGLLMPLLKWYFKRVIAYADVAIAISPMVEESIKAMHTKTKVVRLNNPILLDKWKRNDDLRAKGREALTLKENDFCVLGVGQLISRKGCLDFIEMAKQTPEAQFRWIGGRPYIVDNIAEMDKAIAAAPANVKFMGLQLLEEMPQFYAGADLFVFPSYQENSPLAPIEAAASGMPVIFRDLQEYKMLYESDYFAANDVAQFVSQIKLLMQYKEAYNRGVLLSNELVKQFDKHAIREKLLQLYTSLVATPPKNKVITFNHPPFKTQLSKRLSRAMV